MRLGKLCFLCLGVVGVEEFDFLCFLRLSSLRLYGGAICGGWGMDRARGEMIV